MPERSGRIRGRDPRTGGEIAVERREGRISAIDRRPGPADPDLPWISTGLVDLQVNGYAGFDVNGEDVSIGTIAGLRAALRAVGVTTFVPTIVTSSRERTEHALRVIAEARGQDERIAAAIPFVHLEGPYLSDEDGPRGCHDADCIRPPHPAEFAGWQSACGGLIGMMTLSPHWPGATAFIADLCSGGVRVSIGHTHARPEQIREAVDAGAEYSTHLGNGAHAVLQRHPNYLWSQLADARISAGFIADGHHLSSEVLTAMLRAKGLERSFLVSDVTAVGGLPPGRYRASVGGEVEVTADGRVLAHGTPFLAGAAATLADGVARAATMAGLGLADALRLATSNPGRIVDPRGGRSRITRGSAAELMTFRWRPGDPTLSTVIVDGESP